MAISIGDKLPDTTFVSMGDEGPVEHSMAALTKGKKIVIFALPGAYTGVCSTAHMPSFVKTADAIRAKGIDGIYCLSVNDVFVMKSWGQVMNAHDAGITMLSDADGSYTKKIGCDFTAPPVGLIDRSKRYAMIVENGVVLAMNLEESPGVCDVSGGESILDLL